MEIKNIVFFVAILVLVGLALTIGPINTIDPYGHASGPLKIPTLRASAPAATAPAPTIPVASSPTTYTASRTLCGDVDGNGRVDARDSQATAQIASGSAQVQDPNRCADNNYDGSVSSLDSLRIAQYLSGSVILNCPSSCGAPVVQEDLSWSVENPLPTQQPNTKRFFIHSTQDDPSRIPQITVARRNWCTPGAGQPFRHPDSSFSVPVDPIRWERTASGYRRSIAVSTVSCGVGITTEFTISAPVGTVDNFVGSNDLLQWNDPSVVGPPYQPPIPPPGCFTSPTPAVPRSRATPIGSPVSAGIATTCSETDGGDRPLIAGSVLYSSSYISPTTMPDYCETSPSVNTLVEYFCDFGTQRLMLQRYTCSSGCSTSSGLARCN